MKLTRLEMEDIMKEAKRSHGWMLDTILAEEGNEDNYSDDVKHAISVQKLLEMVE